MTRRRGLVVLVMLLVLCGLLMYCTEADLVLRTLPVGGYPVALAVDQQTSRVFIVNRATRTVADSVSVLDARRGAVVQVVRTDPGQSDAVAVNERTGRAFIVTADANGANGNGTVRVLDTRSDAVLRVIPLNVTTMPAVPVPVVVDERTNRVFVANGAGTCCWAGTVSILDATSGRLLHSVTVGVAPSAVAVDERTARVFVANSDTPGTVSILDASSGVIVHTARVGLLPSAVAVSVRTGRAFVVNWGVPSRIGTFTGAASVSVLDARTGALLRTTRVGINPVAVAVDDRTGRAFVVLAGATDTQGRYTGAGSVSVLDATSGRLLHSVTVGVAPSAVAVDERRGRVYVPVIDGVSILDARTGTVLRAVPFTGTPGPVTVDERTGRVFVGRGDGTVHGSDLWGWMPPELGRWVPLLLAPRPQTVPGSVTMLEITNR